MKSYGKHLMQYIARVSTFEAHKTVLAILFITQNSHKQYHQQVMYFDLQYSFYHIALFFLKVYFSQHIKLIIVHVVVHLNQFDKITILAFQSELILNRIVVLKAF